MSFPVEPDFGQILMGDGATPTEVFTVVCGIENVNINNVVNTSDQFRRDCAKPGEVPSRKVKVTGKQWDITGDGVANTTQFAALGTALGISKNYKVVLGRRDGTDAGVTLGTFSGAAVLTAHNISATQEGATMEVTLAGENVLVWTPTP